MGKLVRDLMPQVWIDNGDPHVPHYIEEDPKEQMKMLRQKLLEEVGEFLEDPCFGEAADVMEVMTAILQKTVGGSAYGILNATIIATSTKRAKRGGFEKFFIMGRRGFK